MAQQWIIEILQVGTAGVAFQPFVPGSQPNDPLRADTNDTVLWSNRTNQDVQLVSATAPSLNQTVEAGRSSAALFVVPAGLGRIDYKCPDPPRDHVIVIVS